MPRKAAPIPEEKKQKREWLTIVAMVIGLCVLGVTYGIGHRQGFEQGQDFAMDFMMQKIHDNLDKPCFDQLANSIAKREDQ